MAMNQTARTLWADNEASIDLLRFGYLADAIAEVATTPSLLPVTVGVFGDWGGGKSTLMRMAQQRLDDRGDVLTLTFNGWLFEGYEEAKAALLGSIFDAIEDNIAGNASWTDKLRAKFDALRQRVDWLRLLWWGGRTVGPVALTGDWRMALPGLAMDALGKGREALGKGELPNLEQVREVLKEAPQGGITVRRTLREFRRDFEDLLDEAGIAQLVVFIDDLDRCLPDTVIETLEAIKLFLFVPGTAFILGADERLIQFAVRQRFPELPGTNTEVGRDYLEKLIQIPIRIPPLNRPDIESYLNLLLAERRLESAHHARICTAIAARKLPEFGALAFEPTIAAELLANDPPTEELNGALEGIKEDCAFTSLLVPVLMPGLAGNPRRAKRFLNTLLLRLNLAERRGLALKRAALAKLMLLEYIRPEFFRSLAAWQAVEQGRPTALFVAEQRARHSTLPKPESVDAKDGQIADAEMAATQTIPVPQAEVEVTSVEELAVARDGSTITVAETPMPAEIAPWFADAWAQDWLALEPRLAAEDLRPYFFVAHDQLDPVGGTHARLSPQANEVLNRLLDPAPLQQTRGIDAAAKLNVPDAGAVFQVLVERLRQSERIDEQSVQPILFRYVGMRTELLPQLVQFCSQLPESRFSFAIPNQLVGLARGTTSAEAVRGLLSRWSQSQVPRLGPAATMALQHLDRTT